MLSYLIVIPAMDQELTETCLASMAGVDPARVIVVDNSRDGLELPWEPGHKYRARRNIGVAASWNIGIRRLGDIDGDILILCSTAVLFSAPGGADLVDQLEKNDGFGLEVGEFGWHLTCITATTLDRVGLFDERFYPGYGEDTDYLYRMGLAGLPSPRENGIRWPKIDIDAVDRGYALHLNAGLVQVNFANLLAYYGRKWGGPQGGERFTVPFERSGPR